MAYYNTIFNNLLQLIPRHQFKKVVNKYNSDKYVKKLTCWNQLTTILYAQAKGKESLRDIETSLKAQSPKLYHLGLPVIKRSTLSDANNKRDYRIFEELFYSLYERCQGLSPKHKFRFKNELYSIDATTIDLCLSVFPWAKFRKRKGAIKMTGVNTSKKYPDKLRLVRYYDEEKDKEYVFITNLFHLSAKTIALIYKARWQIELFFKWIKQNLKIKSFLGETLLERMQLIDLLRIDPANPPRAPNNENQLTFSFV